MIGFVQRMIFALRVLINKNKEPFYSTKYLWNYVKNGYWFISYQKHNYKDQIKVKESTAGKYVQYGLEKIAYPKDWDNELIVNNFNNLLNEQTAIGNNINPHKYLSIDELKAEWVIYDIGAAEGIQSKLWIKHVKQIVIFEPMPSFFEQLGKTFSSEVSEGKVILVNCGVSDSRKEVEMENKKIIFDSLQNLIKTYNLPQPDYIKVDIEGEELNFLNASLQFFEKSNVKVIQITTYHRPLDYINIPNFFKQFNGSGSFSDGVMIFNRDGFVPGKYREKIYHPVIRKCLYTFRFHK